MCTWTVMPSKRRGRSTRNVITSCCVSPTPRRLWLTLALLPPPYRTWGRYYVVPASLLSTLKTLAFGDDKTASSSDVRIDLTPLLESDAAEEVYVIGSGPDRSAGDDSRKLRPSERRKEKLYSLKEGLVESEDFIFVPMGAWTLLTTW
jgi:hypothetical protein